MTGAVLYKDSRNLYLDDRLAALEWLEHGFGTRAAGFWVGDEGLAWLDQVHSDTILVADGRRGRIGEGDGLISDLPGVYVGVRTADCVPILIADPARRAVAAVHAGWRGTLAGIAARAVDALRERFRSIPSDLVVSIGPSIGPCCYTVGPEVARQFRDLYPERPDLETRTALDLAEANRRVLVRAGADPARIWGKFPCTCCRPEDFYSYRRDGEKAGRMLSAIGIRN